MKTNAELLKTLLDITTDNIYVNNPCQVVNVSSDGNFVDVKIFINDEDEDCVLYNVPIQRPETQRAYIFLGIKKGDRGTLKFFDRSTEGYRQGDYDYNSDERQHDINDSCFELGFIPDSESFVYPTDKEIEIGLKDGTVKMSFVENHLSIKTKNAGIDIYKNDILIGGNDITIHGNVKVIGEITANGIPLSTHKHTGVTTGSGTSGTPTI